MKKSIRKAIISLSLCVSASCLVGGLSFMQSEHETAAASTVATSTSYTLDGFTIEETASVRNANPDGIRFTTILSEDTKADIAALNLGEVTYGTLMIPADILGSQELTHETASVLDVVTNSWQEEGEKWTSVLVGSNEAPLSESYYNRPIVARSYVKGTDGSGNTVYYYTENNAIRSIGYVAMIEYLAPDGRVTDVIEKVVAKTDVELVFNETDQISAKQNSTEGTALISNALPVSSDKVAVLKIGGIAAPEQITWTSKDPETGVETQQSIDLFDINYTVSENSDAISMSGDTLTAENEGESSVTATLAITYDYNADKKAVLTGKIADGTAIEKLINTGVFKGTSEYKILINDNSANAANEKKAAELMQKILYEATGVRMPIVTSVKDGEKYISIGETTQATENTSLTVTDATASQLFIVDGNVYIRGVQERAIFYGVQQFLTENVGYEYLMENTYSVNKDQTLVLTGNKEYVRDITHLALQDRADDGYGSQQYSEKIIPLGTSKTYDSITEDGTTYEIVQLAASHQGISHNSVLVVDALAAAAGKEDQDFGMDYGSPETGSQEKWYATATSNYMFGDYYRTILNPYYGNTNDPFAKYKVVKTTDENGNEQTEYVRYSSPQYIKAELCYTAHGDPDSYANLVRVVADEMIARLTENKEMTRVGFTQMDHRKWCQCTICSTFGNATDTLLAFLLDVSANVTSRWSETGRTDSSDNFKIVTLFYHQTNVAPSEASIEANYAADLTAYGKHVEIWFAESAADYTVGLTDTTSSWNTNVLANLQDFKKINDDYKANMDILWWGYYGTTRQFFIPYDSIDALRINYAVAYENGVDYMFNQMMGSKVNFTRLKEYLMGKLTWNAGTMAEDGTVTPVDTTTYNAWIDTYFTGAYGAGSDKMKTYYSEWATWVDNHWAQLQTTSAYDPTSENINGSIARTTALSTDYFKLTDLEKWIGYFDAAIEALDPTDPNYENYYWNIKLEKLTPMFLIMYLYGGNEVEGEDDLGDDWQDWDQPNFYTDTDFDDPQYAQTYGAEFLEIIKHCSVSMYGEGKNFDNFKTAINAALAGASAKATTVSVAQSVIADNSFILQSGALTSGTYTATVTSGNQTLPATVTVKSGVATVTLSNNATLTAGSTYNVVLSSESAVVTFTNVSAVADSDDYIKAEKRAFVAVGEQDAWLYDAHFTAGNSYVVSVDGVETTVRCFVAGKIHVQVGTVDVGATKTVYCSNASGKPYAFTVIGATAIIKNAAQLAQVGIGTQELTNAFNNDVDGYYALEGDINCAGRIFTPGHNYGNSNFIGTFDGNGYTISNLIVGDSGIFGGLNNATIKDVNFKGVEIELSATAGYNYGALLAHAAKGMTTIENVTAQFTKLKDSEEKAPNYLHTGLLIANGTRDSVVYKNVELNVVNVAARTYWPISVFGSNLDLSALTCENVKLYVKPSQANDDAQLIYGYTDNKKQESVTDKPAGVTIVEAFGIKNTEKEIKAGGELTIETNAQESDTITLELVDDFGGLVTLEGNKLTVDASVAPNTEITIVATRLSDNYQDRYTVTVAKLEGAVEAELIISKADGGVFNVPDVIGGEIDYVKVGGVTIYNRKAGIGSISGTEITCDSVALAKLTVANNQTMIIANETTAYSLSADVCEEIITITSVADLYNLGVGGNRKNTKNIDGYYVLEDDITITHEADYSDLLAAGYPLGGDYYYYFRGTLNGNGYTINNMRVSDGGLFGLMRGATVKNVNFTNVHMLDDLSPEYTNQGGGYMAIFAHSAPSTTFENIEISIATPPSRDGDYAKREGLFVCSSSWGAATYRNITVDASGLKLQTLLGISHDDANVYENVLIIAESYVAIGYDGDEYLSWDTDGDGEITNADKGKLNEDAMMGAFPDGVKFEYVPSFKITNGTDAQVGTGITLAIDKENLDVEYRLQREVDGVTLNGNVLTIDLDVEFETSFTVIAKYTSPMGYVFEAKKTFETVVREVVIDKTITIEAITDTFDFSAISEELAGITEEITSVKIGSLTIFSGTPTAGVNQMESRPVKATHLGENKTITLQTATTKYLVNANVYTMIINTADELDQWQSVAADNSVAAGLVIEAQKNAVLSGYFALGNDIEYNKVWTPIAKYAGGTGSLYQLLSAGIDVPADTEGAIWESWTNGDKAGFKGVFDGNGHAIKGLETSGIYSGFVVVMGGGTIKDVAFTGAKIGATSSFIYDRGNGTLENVYVQVTAMESGTDSAGDSFTTVFKRSYSTYNVDSTATNVIVDLTAIDYASLTRVYVANLGTYANTVYVLGATDESVELYKNGTFASNGDSPVVDPVLFREYNSYPGTDYDDIARFDNAKALVNDEDYRAIVSAWGDLWTINEENEFYFGDYMIYDGLVEIVAENTLDVNFGHTLAGTAVVMGDTAQVDLSEIYADYLAGNTVTVKYFDTVIYEGTIDSATWDMPLSAFAVTDVGEEALTFVIGKTKITLTMNIVQNVIELNSSNVANPTALQSILNSNTSGHYVLTSDLNMGGAMLKAVETFNGTIDGNGFGIINTYIAWNSATAGAGAYSPQFIHSMGVNGRIQNIRFELKKLDWFEASQTHANGFHGNGHQGIVAYNKGTIENVYVDVTLNWSAKGTQNPARGILTRTNTGTINNVIINVKANGGITLVANAVGAIYGTNSGTMTNGYVITNGVANLVDVASGSVTAYEAWADVPAANVAAWGAPWSVDGAAVSFGNAVIYDGITIEEIDDVVTISAKDGTFTVPAAITAEVTSVILDGDEIFSSYADGVVTFDNTALMAKAAADLGENRSLSIKTGSRTYELKANVYTDIITTAAELKAIGMGGNNKTATAHLTGYYKLGANITFTHQDDNSDIIAAGYHAAGGHKYYFKGVFDGIGYTIDNMRVSDGGIFGYVDSATIRNLTLTNVQVIDTVAKTVSEWDGGYSAILAYTAVNATFENINISVASYPSAYSYQRIGLFVCRNENAKVTYKDITVDATGLTLKNMLGIHHNAKAEYTNVVIKAANFYAIGYTGDSYTTSENTHLRMDDFPAGVTFVPSGVEIVRNDGSTYTGTLTDYEGDVTGLGFAAGTNVVQAYFPDNDWNDRIKLSAVPSTFDYVDVQFKISVDTYLTLWDGVSASYTVRANSVTKAAGVTYDRAVQILDANGQPISISVFDTNTVYTLRMYLTDVDGGNYVKKWQISAGAVATTMYFGNISFGKVTHLDETVVADLETKNITLPDGFSGNLESVMLGCTTIYSSTTGALAGNVVTFTNVPAAEETYVVIKTDAGIFVSKAIVATKLIKTAADLQALGVGGKVEDGVTIGQGNSLGSGQDITGYYVLANNIDGTGVYFSAGYKYGNTSNGGESFFKGTVNGMGYTVSNVILSEGGIFGAIQNATIKNINFTNVAYHGNNAITGFGKGYNNNIQYGQYFGLFGYTASGLTVSDVTIQISEYLSKWNSVGLFLGRAAGKNTFTNVAVDAAGLDLNVVFAQDGSNMVYDNVSVKAASYVTIGYSDSGSTALTEWPAGVTFEVNRAIKQDVSSSQVDTTYRYTGDVTALGFEEGTSVFVVEQDSRTSMWSAGTNGYTMERQKVYIYKDADEDYASVLFALNKDATADVFSSGYMFFAWGFGENNASYTTNAGAGYLKTNGQYSASGNFKAAAYNLDGTIATSFKANTVYELRWYNSVDPVVKIGVGVCNQSTDGSSVTVYFAKSTSGNSLPVERWGGNLLSIYDGDVTALGFAEGTTVGCLTDTVNYNNRASILFDSSYDYVDVQFSTANALSSLHLWAPGQHCLISASGVTHDSGNPGRTVQILDANGAAVTAFAAKTVYTLRIYIKDANGTAATTLAISTLSAATGAIYFGNVTFGNF